MNLFNFFTPKAETYYMTEDTTIRQALEKFDYHKFTVVPLISEDGKYITTVTEGDILRYIKNEAKFNIEEAENVLVMDIDKYRPYNACKPDTSVEEIMKLAMDQNFVPLVDDRNYYIGIIKRKSILNTLYDHYNNCTSHDFNKMSAIAN